MLSSKSKFAVAVLSILLSINLAKSAFAGSHAEAMSEWTERVSEKISAKMIYPRNAHVHAVYNVAELIVAPDGTVVAVGQIMNCQTESCILALRDTEVIRVVETGSGKTVTYRALQKHGSTQTE